MQKTPVSTSASQRDEWFDGIVSSLRSDQLQLQADIADSKKKQQYEVLIEGNPLKTLAMGRELTSKYFIGNIIRNIWFRKILLIRIVSCFNVLIYLFYIYYF